MSIEGDLNFTPASSYDWEAAFSTEADQVTVTQGTATLSGVFRPILLDDYVPTIGQSFTVLTAPAITGTFDFVDQSSLPPGLTVNLGYNATSVTVTFAATSLSDFESWRQTRFTPAEQLDETISGPNADPDGDGILNKAEFAHGLNPKLQEAYPFEVVAATDTTMDLRFPWAAGDHATYSVRTSPEVRNFLPVASELQNTSPDIRPGVDEITIRTTHPGTRTQFSTLVIELAP